MARGRLISRSLSTSEKWARLHRAAGRLAEFCQSLYPLLVAHADDFGRLAGDVFTVKHAVAPTSPRKDSDFSAALAALHAVQLINWYESDGRNYIQINDFDSHQSGLHKRTDSKIPPPSGKFPEIPSEEKGTELKGTEEKRDRRDKAAPDPRVHSLARFFNALHVERLGTKAAWDGGKDGALLKGLLQQRDEPELQTLMRAFFASSDPFIVGAGYTVGVFKSQIGKLLVRTAKAVTAGPYVSPRDEFNQAHGVEGPAGWREECAADHGSRCNDAFAHWQKTRSEKARAS